MKKILILIVAFLLIALVSWLLLQFSPEEPNTNTNQNQTSIEVQNRYDSKIVYRQDDNIPQDVYRQHCENLGGDFDNCGSTCPPNSEVCATVCGYVCENIGIDIDTSNWQEDEQKNSFNFNINYPKDWSKNENFDIAVSPKFNYYMSLENGDQLPLDHFSNVNHVSIYPQGIPTEGLFSQTRDVNMDLDFEIDNTSRVFVLEDGTPFAAIIRPSNPPASWNESGFILARLKIDNYQTKCLRDGQEVDEGECDPLINKDQIVHIGSVDSRVWELEKEILRNINLNQSASIDDLIILDSPQIQEKITSPLTITGQARGTWYFEATFPIVLTDWDGKIIAQHYAEAQDDWMTEEFVPFEATLTFDSPVDENSPDFMRKGSLILQKSNPSGLPEHDNALEIMIQF